MCGSSLRPSWRARPDFATCKRCQPDRSHLRDPVAERVLSVCHYIRSAHDETLTLARLGKRFSFSPAHLQRVFKQYVGISPLAYAEAVRMNQLKLALQDGASVTDAIYASGFSSSSRVYERAARAIGMTPRRYKDRGRGEQIRFSIVPSALGRLLVASTARVFAPCSLVMTMRHSKDCCARSSATLRSSAAIETMRNGCKGWVRLAEGRAPHLSLPLDIRGTAFQQQVWRALQKIPAGRTRSYAEVARSIRAPRGDPGRRQRLRCKPCSARRAVPPCRADRRWIGRISLGVGRKRELLEAEHGARRRNASQPDDGAVTGVAARSE